MATLLDTIQTQIKPENPLPLFGSMTPSEKVDWLRENGYQVGVGDQLAALKEGTQNAQDANTDPNIFIADYPTQKSDYLAYEGNKLAQDRKASVDQANDNLKLAQVKAPTLMEQLNPPPKTAIVPVTDAQGNVTYTTKSTPQASALNTGDKNYDSSFSRLVGMGMTPKDADKAARQSAQYQSKLIQARNTPTYKQAENLHKAVLDEVVGPENYQSQWNPNLDYWDNFNNIISNMGSDVGVKARSLLASKEKGLQPEIQPHAALQRLSNLEMAKLRIKGGSPITQDDATQNPILAGLLGIKDPAMLKKAYDELDKESQYLRKFIPQDTGGQTTPTEATGQGTQATQVTHPLQGKQPGKYMVSGKIVKWNGNQEIQ